MSGGNESNIFDDIATSYDRSHSANVPDPDGFYGAVVDGLPFGVDEELRVLDLGAGTGLLSAVVSKRFPKAHVTLADSSEGMLDVARERFAGEPDRYEFVVTDYVKESLPGGEEEYDLVVCALSFHHLTNAGKQEAIRKVHAALADGGWFVVADKVSMGTPVGHSGHHGHSGHTGTEQVGVGDHARWMRECGFLGVETRYEKDDFAVIGGYKSDIQRKERQA